MQEAASKPTAGGFLLWPSTHCRSKPAVTWNSTHQYVRISAHPDDPFRIKPIPLLGR
jgi:hypothetical protein